MRYWLICTWLFLIYLTNGKAQDSLITTYLKNKDWLSVALLYEKMALVSDSENLKITYKLLSAQYYKYSNEYNQAIELLKTIDLSHLNDSLKYTILYQMVLNDYLADDLKSAESECVKLYYSVHDTSLHYNIIPLHVLILNKQYKWKDAKNFLLKYNNFYFRNDSIKRMYYKNIIDSLYNSAILPKLKSVNKSIILSTFIPGAGQIYTRNYSEGIIAFVSNASIVAVSLLGIYYQYYFTSIIAGSSLLAKFYTGNLNRAEFLAHQYNLSKSKHFNTALKNFVVNTYLK